MHRFSAVLSALVALSICSDARAEERATLNAGIAVEQQLTVLHQFAVYDRCMLKPRDTPCLGIDVVHDHARQSSVG